MGSPEDKWAKFHEKALPYEQAIVQEPFKTLIDTVVGFVREYKLGSVFETGFGTGYSLINLSQRLDATVTGIESSEILIDRAANLGIEKGANTFFQLGDAFSAETYQPNYDLIYHQGLLEHLSDDKIKELLELQTANSFAVIFSVPSIDYGRKDFGNERLLELKEWKGILSDFDILKLFPYDQGKHILGILKGRLYDGE